MALGENNPKLYILGYAFLFHLEQFTMKAGNRYQIKTTAYFKYEFDKSYAFRNCISSFHQKHTIIGWKSAAVSEGWSKARASAPENKENIWDEKKVHIIHQEILMHSEEYPSQHPYPKGNCYKKTRNGEKHIFL